MELSDGHQSVRVRVTNYLLPAFGAYSGTAYKQLNLGNYWAGTYFWSNAFNGNETASTASTQNASIFQMTSLQGAINPFDNFPSVKTLPVNKSNANTTYLITASAQVRCVRGDNGATPVSSGGTTMNVTDYGKFE